ncbi:MAG: sigma factor-like helix-turn-helix DNA-binding protein, partial [Verrucomicrobiota bacterium]
NDRRKTARRSRILHENVTDILTSTAGKIEVEEGKTDSEEELVEALKNCLDEMPEKSRMLLQRRYEENARAVDLASALDMNAATVRKNLERIRTSLRKCVELRVSPQGSA